MAKTSLRWYLLKAFLMPNIVIIKCNDRKIDNHKKRSDLLGSDLIVFKDIMALAKVFVRV